MGIDYLIFNDVDSRNYDIEVFFKDIDHTPKRVYEIVEVPGRNGAIYADQKRYEDVSVAYDCVALDDADRKAFVNALASQIGRKRLQDSFNDDEFYHAVFDGDVEPSVTSDREQSTFSVYFTRSPQRFLTSGETAVTIGEWGETETASGDIVTVENPNGVLAVKSLKVSLEPIQSGSGTPSPDNVRPISGRTEVVTQRAGKNLFEALTSGGRSNSGITWTYNSDGSLTATGTATGNSWSYGTAPSVTLPSGTYTVSVSSPFSLVIRKSDNTYIYNGDNSTHTFTLSKSTEIFIYARLKAGTTVSNATTGIMLEVGSTASEWTPYNGDTYTTALGRTVYGGTVDIVSGLLTVDKAMITLDGSEDEAWTGANTRFAIIPDGIYASGSGRGEVWSNEFIYSSSATSVGTIFLLQSSGQVYVYPPVSDSLANFKTWLASNPLQIVYPLATPQTYQLTAQQIELLTGDNIIWSSGGTITLEYGQDPSVLFNPTLFEASPLLEVEGYGNIDVNGFDVSIENVVFGDIQVSEKVQNSAKLDITNCNSGDLLYTKVQGSARTLMGRWEAKITGKLGAKVQGQTSTGSALRYYGPYYVGTPWSETWVSSTLNVTVSYGGTTYSAEVTLSPTMTYDGDDTISIGVATTKTGDGASYIDVAVTAEIYPFWCNSTKTILGHPTCVDCDLGEAYKVENDEIISLNAYIALGSKLPTLAVGENEITFDNTFTEVKVTPRWWKV